LTTDHRPSLPALELQIAKGDLQGALETALQILAAIDKRYGRLDDVQLGDAIPGRSDEDRGLDFSNRFAMALSNLIVNPNLTFSSVAFEGLLIHHRWIDLIFALSRFRTSDHLIPLLAKITENRISFEGSNFLRHLTMRSMNSAVEINFDDYLRGSAASLLAFLFYASSGSVFWSRAFDFRERLLEWLPGKLGNIKLDDLSLSRLPEIYMHCSYAITPRKHAIKVDLVRQVRRASLEFGCVEVSPKLPDTIPKRPTIIVVAEHFFPEHAVYRTHSRAVASLRERFNVVGLIGPTPSGVPVEDIFDEYIALPALDFMPMVRQLADEITSRNPVLIFYLGVGMVAQIIALASMRLAPIQCVSFGHTASTMSGAIDYFILPQDFVGAPEAFSEKLLTVPKAAMPFTSLASRITRRPEPDGVVRVAIPASIMKLNPRLFKAIGHIVKHVKSKTEIHFFPLLASGLPYLELSRAVAAWIPTATVFPESDHELYIERLSKCQLFLCPFPYGNMNSIIDAFHVGIPGVCLDGVEAHAHADAALFARIGLPQSLCAKTVDDYITSAVRLIDNAGWRDECSKIVADADLDAAFFRGDVSLFCDALAGLVWANTASN